MEDRKRKNVSCLSKIPRESTWKILETITHTFNNNGAKDDYVAILTVSHTTMGSKAKRPVNWIRQKIEF